MPPKRSAPAPASNDRSKKAKSGAQDDGRDPTAPPRRNHRWSAVSGSANADDAYRLAARNPELAYVYNTICEPPFARRWDKKDDADKEEEDEDEDEDNDSEDGGGCGGENCLCNKPAAEHPDHKWVLSKAGFRKYIALRIMAQLRCPDNFDMSTFNDHEAYGILEIIENVLLDFDEAKADWKEQWAICEGAIMFLSSSDADPMTRADDGDRCDAACELIGRMFLTMLARLERENALAEGSEIRNLGLITALYIIWPSGMRAYGLLEGDEEDKLAQKTKKGGPVIAHFDDYLVAYAGKSGIALAGPKNFDETLSKCDRDVELPDATAGKDDPWGWAKALKQYEKEHGGGHPASRGSKKSKIGGDSLDITAWSSAARKAASFNSKDPLGRKEIEAIKKGMVLQMG